MAAQAPPMPDAGGEGLEAPERLVAAQLAAAAEITRMEAEKWSHPILSSAYHVFSYRLCLVLCIYLAI